MAIVFYILAFLWAFPVYAQDFRLRDLTAITTPSSTDILYIVHDPSGTPVDRKITVANLLAGAGTYEAPLTFSTGLTRTTNTVTVNTIQNIARLSNLTGNGFVKTGSSNGTLSVDTSTYLTANQTITLSGDCTGSGTTAITTTCTGGGGGSGTVTSVGLVGTANQITVTGASPITTSGSWTLSLPAAVSVTTSLTTPLHIGGTTTTSPLTLQSTSGVGAAGADIIFLVGNNGATEAARILNSGLVGIGTVTPITELSVASSSASDPRGIRSSQHSTDTTAARIHLAKSRGTNASPTTIVTGDVLGRVRFSGYDGTNYLQMGSIDVTSTGTIASTRVPTTMTFSTATDAAPSVLTTGLTIGKNQFVAIGSGVATPLRQLHVASPSGVSSVILLQNGSTGYTTSDGFEMAIDSNNLAGFTNYEANAINFYTGGGANSNLRAAILNSPNIAVYNTFTDASNNEYLQLGFTSNVATLSTVANGTGTGRSLTLAPASGTITANSQILQSANAWALRSVSNGFQFAANLGLKWSNSANDYDQTLDTGLARNAAGVIESNNGTAGTLRDFKARNFIAGASMSTSMTDGFVNIAGAAGTPTGTPATTTGVPTYWDTTNHKLYGYYGGAWHAESYQASDATLTSLAAFNTNGILTQTAADTFTGRTITGTANVLTVTNGDGVSGNPTLTLPTAIIDGSSHYCADAGANDTYTCSLTPAPSAYVNGAYYAFKANTANTGAATINFNSLGAKTIVKVTGGVTTALADNDIRVGQVVLVQYDGTNMQIQSTLGNAPATVPGSDTQVIFNDGGALGADSGMTYNKTTDVLTVAGGLVQGNCATNCLTHDTSAVTGSKTATWQNLSGTIPIRIASGTKALATSAIASAACSSAQTSTATGTATTDVVAASFNGDPTAVTGYVPLTAGMLTIIAYPTADTVNFKVCNNTASSITPGAITLNWIVTR